MDWARTKEVRDGSGNIDFVMSILFRYYRKPEDKRDGEPFP